MDVALYIRVSSDKQDVDLSVSAQLRALREYAAKHGHTIVREFVDEAETARNADRPAFREMIALARGKHPPFEAILVWKYNRFSRNRTDSVTIKSLLQKKGIQVISINEPVDNSPVGHLMEGVIECIDEFYSANMGEDIRRGMRETAQRGFFVGSRPPDGFRRVPVRDGVKTRYKLELVEDSVRVRLIQRIFDMADQDTGCKEIAQVLNREGFCTSTGSRWSKTSVHKVLTNEAYCGTLVWGGRPGHRAIKSGVAPVREENAWPAIIDQETFHRVQQKMADKGPRMIHPRTVVSSYLLSGLLFCSCGAAMTGRSAKSNQYFYYTCSRSFKQGKDGCDARSLPKDEIERLVITKIRQRVLTDENLEELVRLVNEELGSAHDVLQQTLLDIDAEIRDVESRLSRLYDVLETGKLELNDLAPRIRELRSRQDDLRKARLQAEADFLVRSVEPVDTQLVKQYAQDLKQLLEEAEFSERKSFLRSFVKRIEIKKEQATVHYNLPLPHDGHHSRSKEVLPIVTFGGAEETRTPDFLRAKQALSQLSYSPPSAELPPLSRNRPSP